MSTEQTRGEEKLKALTARERTEMRRLGRLWATRRATAKQIERFQSLARRDNAVRAAILVWVNA